MNQDNTRQTNRLTFFFSLHRLCIRIQTTDTGRFKSLLFTLTEIQIISYYFTLKL